MKIDVGPLLDAIDRYIAKADSDLEENLSAEGYVGAAKAVQLAGELEEAVAVMLFYQVGELFSDYAVNRSRRSIANFNGHQPGLCGR